jgi:hydrogenase maturation protein HypF
MMLQAEAERHNAATPYGVTTNAFVVRPSGRENVLDWQPAFTALLADRDAGVDIPTIAARFHRSMVELILAGVNNLPDLPVVLCGGCFQNAWLLEQTVSALESLGRNVYWPQKLPPNDGAISVGQVMAGRKI